MTFPRKRAELGVTTGALVAAPGLTEFGYLSSQSIGLAPGDEYQLMILDSVGGGTCCGYRDGFHRVYATVDARMTRVGSSRVLRPISAPG
jgi:hypothetical protein